MENSSLSLSCYFAIYIYVPSPGLQEHSNSMMYNDVAYREINCRTHRVGVGTEVKPISKVGERCRLTQHNSSENTLYLMLYVSVFYHNMVAS